jgi:hypothetical protein
MLILNLKQQDKKLNVVQINSAEAYSHTEDELTYVENIGKLQH